ncbi:MAG: branched-chain amino acid ABC transporter permease [Anaerolineaceae bacterium]|nr:branched-chain amino acid ABC transporter permease [Anaerolineaceae bacterium]
MKLQKNLKSFFSANRFLLLTVTALSLLPFVISLIEGQPISDLMANEAGLSKFIQGLAVEVFILAVYALSYDLIFGITGILSFGHAMFYSVGAYLAGILIKLYGWPLLPTIGMVVLAGIIQAVIFAIVMPRVKGLTYGLVTLGLSTVFYIVIQSREMSGLTGADQGLQGVIPPDFLNPSTERLRVYFIAMLLMFLVYFLIKRFVNSPTGRVCIAIRENETRALMLGYNTFYYKFIALVISSIIAAFAGVMHTIYHPVISPYQASLAFTTGAILIVLIGGIGTLSGAMIGAAVFRLLSYGLERYLGEVSGIIIGVIYIAIVLFFPYGIVGTWNQKSFQLKEGRDRLWALLTGKKKESSP